MRKNLIILLLCCIGSSAFAKHITGGEVIYDYMGPGSIANSKKYRITLRLFRDNNCFSTPTAGCAELPMQVSVALYDNDTHMPYGGFRAVSMSNTEILNILTAPTCLTNPPMLNYSGGYYTFDIDLPNNNAGYTYSYQTCCRVDGIANVTNNIGATYTTAIPGNATLGVNETDNSARFQTGISIICYNKPFTLDFSATDPDAAASGDSLVYAFFGAYDGGDATGADFNQPAAPPYNTIGYINGYTGSQPLGGQAFINSETGIISGIAPDAGKYVVSVLVYTYRHGRIINTHRKDFIVTVAPCDFAGAQLAPSYTSCDGFTVNFTNLNNSPLNLTYYWDFGDGNTSTDQSPVHTYAAAGDFPLKLVVNRGDNCADSTTSIVKVYPGYFPGFTNNAPMCKDIPVQFNDITTANYGAPNYWRWNFGVAALTNDTSRAKNPTYAYTTAGDYKVTLIVASDKGCIDTINTTITIVDKPAFSVTNDTLICAIDNLTLMATASVPGSFTWSPNYMINTLNTATPVVSPDVTTTYRVQFSDNFGCSAVDSVKVRVVNEVTLNKAADSTICLTDSVTLRLNTDALYFAWTPAATLNNSAVQNPVATPTQPVTTYNIRASISANCFKDDAITIRTVPYPDARSGEDTAVCFGTNAFLHASGGSTYFWSPGTFLNNQHIANPTALNPASDTRYIVAVYDNKGCPKPAFDTTLVKVTKIIANAGPRDTSVVLGQPLQLTATGSSFYTWTPATWLSDATVFNPIALPEDNIEYALKVYDAQGCFGLDSINVKLYKVDPDLFVPTAFSPEGDGNNDIFRPIPIGMRSLESFRVYNRWGQLLYATKQIGSGWDGKFKGAEQGPGTYVWYAEGTDYRGKVIKKKGSVILIR